ncbi:hypothetical protein J3F84DRAFT_382729 [Trichoderma pleuroticola]
MGVTAGVYRACSPKGPPSSAITALVRPAVLPGLMTSTLRKLPFMAALKPARRSKSTHSGPPFAAAQHDYSRAKNLTEPMDCRANDRTLRALVLSCILILLDTQAESE